MEIRHIPLFKGIDAAERRLPVLIERAKERGPVLWLTAVSHGDEFTGIPVLHRIFNYFKKNPLKRGTIYGLPIMNILGFELIKRENPYDDQDINRSFPGDIKGDTTERLAAMIFNNIIETNPDLVIDIHSDTLNSIPYIIVDRPLSDEPKVKETVEKSWQFSERFGVTVTYDIDIPGYRKYQLDKSLTASLINRANITAFLVELGGPNILNETFIRTGTKGIKNILVSLKMIDQKEPAWVSETKIETKGRMELLETITTNENGLIEYLVRPGQFAKTGTRLATITNILGKTEEVICVQRDCYIIALGDRAVSFPGSPIINVAAEEVKK